MLRIREGNWASISPKNHTQVTHLADLWPVSLSTHYLASGCVQPVFGVQSMPRVGPAIHIICPPLCTVGMYLMTAVSLPVAC